MQRIQLSSPFPTTEFTLEVIGWNKMIRLYFKIDLPTLHLNIIVLIRFNTCHCDAILIQSNPNPHHRYFCMKINRECLTESSNSNQFDPRVPTALKALKPWCFKPKKSMFQFQSSVKKGRKFNSLHWTLQENRRYAEFLSEYLFLINGQANVKRKYHLNRMMSKFVKSRSPIQCRSHHQKMLKTFGSNEEIITKILLLSAQSAKQKGETTGSSERDGEIKVELSVGTSFFQEEPEVVFLQKNSMAKGDASIWDSFQYSAFQEEEIDCL